MAVGASRSTSAPTARSDSKNWNTEWKSRRGIRFGRYSSAVIDTQDRAESEARSRVRLAFARGLSVLPIGACLPIDTSVLGGCFDAEFATCRNGLVEALLGGIDGIEPSTRRQSPKEPGLRQSPFALDRGGRDLERVGRFVDVEPREESELHDAALPVVD